MEDLTVQRFRRLPRDIDPELPEVFNFETSTDAANKYLVLDGQQRLTSIFAAFKGTYSHKRLYIDALSGSPEGKDPEMNITIANFSQRPR